MPLVLTLTHLGGAGNRESRSLSQGTFTIGRAPGNDWTLPDPDRHLSKTHCMISAENGRYILTDVSTNGVFVNGSRQAAGRDAMVVLGDGDEFRLGDYSIGVAETPDMDEAGSYGRPGQAGNSPFGAPFGSGFAGQGGGFTPAQHDPFSGSGPVAGYSADDGPLGGDPLLNPFGASPSPAFQHPQRHAGRTERAIDPFDVAEEDSQRGRPIDDDDLFAKPQENWKGASQADHLDAQHQSFTAPKISAPVNMTEMDFDSLLGDMPPPGAPSGFQQQPAPPSPFGMPAAKPPVNFDDLSLDDLLGDGPVAPPAPAIPPPATLATPVIQQAAVTAPAAAPPVPVKPAQANPFDEGDLDALLDGPVAPPAVKPAVSPSQPPSPGITLTMPLTLAPDPAAAPPSPATGAAPPAARATASPGGSADAAALWAIFLEGAGVPDLKAGGDDPEASVRAAGQLFRIMVEGLREVLMSRAAIKSEMRVEQTVIRARDNNALKFSVTADEAIAAMLMPNRPGYKAPLDASKEAFADIKSHELAVMAGMQTALMSLLKRFDPEAIEKRLQPGKLDGFLPGARKARIWELFCATYKDLAKEAEDDFQSVFGNEFARAYDAQMRKF